MSLRTMWLPMCPKPINPIRGLAFSLFVVMVSISFRVYWIYVMSIRLVTVAHRVPARGCAIIKTVAHRVPARGTTIVETAAHRVPARGTPTINHYLFRRLHHLLHRHSFQAPVANWAFCITTRPAGYLIS